MSRYIEAYKSYNKNKQGEKFWGFYTTENNLVMDAVQRILFGRVFDYGFEVLTIKEARNQFNLYKDMLDCFNGETRQQIINSFEKLFSEADKFGVNRLLFKLG